MNASTRSSGRTLWVATRALLMFTLVLGVGYTLVITGIGQLLLPAQANASLVQGPKGAVVGSALIGQSYSDDGKPSPKYFQPRPSAAGDGYDGGASSGSNWGPENADLIAAIKERRAQIAEFNNVSVDKIPADAVTASGSGLDPHISPEYARLQIERVAASRQIPVAKLRAIVDAHIQAPDFGFLGEHRVNVLKLNVALDKLGD